MKKKKWNRLFSVLFVMVTVISLLSGCGRKSAEKEDAETITVYLWSTQLYEKYAPYIQKQLPDINIEFVVGNNDLDFYRFLKENGGLPDIITCCRFSLHDASPLKDSLMDLSTTNEAGAVYNSMIFLCQRITKALFLLAGNLKKQVSVVLRQTIIMIIHVWKRCRDCLHQSFLLQPDANGVPSTVIRKIQREKAWTVQSGRRLLNVWSDS